ncbi:MAG: EamA family transporter [Pseudomonadota bacterium]
MTAFLCMATIYLIWGSTYLAMRIGVMPGSGFTPFTMAGTRLIVAGSLLLLISKLKGNSIRTSVAELKHVLVSGILLWGTGHLIILWSAQYIDSGYTALIISSTPMWVLLMESLIDRKYPDIRLIGLILTGLLGIILLLYPQMNSGSHLNMLSVFLIVIGSISWGAGSMYMQRVHTKLSTISYLGYQQLLAGVVIILLSLCLGDPMPSPTLSAFFAWGYLVIFGSIISLTAYLKVLKLLPLSVVMTTSYVNSMVAVTLGYIFLDEKITPMMLLGGCVVIVAVYGIIKRKKFKYA